MATSVHLLIVGLLLIIEFRRAERSGASGFHKF
jgi:hypothetical protein